MKAARLSFAPLSPSPFYVFHRKIYYSIVRSVRYVRVYTDGARGDTAVGLGWCIEHEGDTIRGHRYIVGDFTSMEAEYFALLGGLRNAKQMYNGDVTILTDCEPLVKKMSGPTGESDEWRKRYRDCEQMRENFDWSQIEWIPRSQNEKANTEASIALRKARNQ